ncbi:MAG: PQQ-binding-like beta-propeller repeat protein, partial [Lacipirellulaceae bacterium]
GELAWEFPTRTRVECSPLIVGEHVFFGTVRGRLYLVDLKTGEDVWDFNAGGGFIASPAISDGRIIIGNTDGTLYCFGAGGTTDEH